MFVELITVYSCFVLFTHYVRIVVCVGLSANGTECVFFVGTGKDYFGVLLEQKLFDMLCMLCQLDT